MRVTLDIRPCDVDTRRDTVHGYRVTDWESCTGLGVAGDGHCTNSDCDGAVWTLDDGRVVHVDGRPIVTRALGVLL